MKIVIDLKKIKRYGKVGSILRWASLGFLGIGVYAIFNPMIFNNENLVSVYFGVMIVGVILSSLSNYLTSRYGRSPRPDELLDKSLKGLDDRFTIFHYQLSIPHLLVSSAGIWTLVPTFVDGKIVYDPKKKTWIRKGGSFLNRFLAREAFGRPDKEIAMHTGDIQKFLKTKGISKEFTLHGVVVLLNKNATLDEKISSENIDILTLDKLKEKIRKTSKLSEEVPVEILTAFKSLIATNTKN